MNDEIGAAAVDNDTVMSADANDDEFEYDEDGNIIIPEVVDEDDEANDAAGEDVDAEEDAESDEEDGHAEDGTEENADNADDQPEAEKAQGDAEKDKALEEYKRKYEQLLAQGKETLKKLGVKDAEDVLAGLENLAAEAEDVSLDDYRKKKAEEARAEEAVRTLQRLEFEKKAAADLAELKRFYPELKDAKTIYEIPNLSEFGRLRDMGVSPRQAYAAANIDGIAASAAQAVKQQTLNDTKNHLRSAVPKGSKDSGITMPRETLREWRDMFPKLSDKEIINLYKNTN